MLSLAGHNIMAGEWCARSARPLKLKLEGCSQRRNRKHLYPSAGQISGSRCWTWEIAAEMQKDERWCRGSEVALNGHGGCCLGCCIVPNICAAPPRIYMSKILQMLPSQLVEEGPSTCFPFIRLHKISCLDTQSKPSDLNIVGELACKLALCEKRDNCSWCRCCKQTFWIISYCADGHYV